MYGYRNILMTKVAIIIGSSRESSNTARFAKAIKINLEARQISHIRIPDARMYDIPFLNKGSLSIKTLTPYQSEVYDSVAQADVVFFLSPEYNWTMSAEILNLFHQFGSKDFSKMWEGKTFAFAGVSTGRGGKMPAIDMSRVVGKLVGFFGFKSFISPKIFESQFTTKALDPNGSNFGNEGYDKGLDDFIDYHINTI
jgi:chromate reductase, NAD(P)H dehydrogenase (quinone)